MEKLDDLEETSDLGFESSTISSLDQGADNSFAYYTTYLRYVWFLIWIGVDVINKLHLQKFQTLS